MKVTIKGADGSDCYSGRPEDLARDDFQSGSEDTFAGDELDDCEARHFPNGEVRNCLNRNNRNTISIKYIVKVVSTDSIKVVYYLHCPLFDKGHMSDNIIIIIPKTFSSPD